MAKDTMDGLTERRNKRGEPTGLQLRITVGSNSGIVLWEECSKIIIVQLLTGYPFLFSRAKNVQILFQKLHFSADSVLSIYRIIVCFVIIPTSAPALGAGGREFESRHSDHKKSYDTAPEMAIASWLYLLYKCFENAGLCVFYALLAQKLLTEQTELNRELCAALHCSTRTKSAILFMG